MQMLHVPLLQSSYAALPVLDQPLIQSVHEVQSVSTVLVAIQAPFAATILVLVQIAQAAQMMIQLGLPMYSVVLKQQLTVVVGLGL